MDTSVYLSTHHLPLPDADLMALARRVRTGDTEARELMILHNMRLVVRFAKPYMNQRNIEDLVSEGTVGLIYAVDRYKPELGFKFSTYASWWIRQALQRAIYNSSQLNIPQRHHEAAASIRRAMQHGTHDVNHIAEQTLLDIDTVHHLLGYLDTTYPSLDQVWQRNNGENLTLGHLLRDPYDDYADIDEQSARDERIEHVLAVLDHKEREIISLYYGLHNDRPLKIREIAVKCGVSRQSVDVRYNKAMAKLRMAAGVKAVAS